MDMNSYFASVEQQANPFLRGRPVGVCEHLGGIIIAPSVEAKRLGIKLGTPVWQAVKVAPNIVLLDTDPAKYREVNHRFLQILGDYTDEVEEYSIDEAFIDVSRYCHGDFREALLLGLEIKQRLYQEIGEWVSASIGIGPNKLVAKIAADLGEGDIDRIAVVRREDFGKLYDRLKLTDIPGIGSRLEHALHKLGIYNLKELAQYPESNLINYFGIWGRVLRDLANFSDDSEITRTEEELPKSVGHCYTMAKATDKPRDLKRLMFKLAEKIGRRMRKYGARGNVVHYFHSDKRYESFSKQRRLAEYVNDGQDIYQAVLKVFENNLKYPVKIMGLTVSGLVFDHEPEPLFEEFKKPSRLLSATDKINNKYGEFTMSRGLLLGAHEEWAKDTVGFGRTRKK